MHITIVLPLTRKQRVSRIKEDIRAIKTEHKISLVAISDSNTISVDTLEDLCKGYDAKVYSFNRPGASDINISARRARISEVFNKARTMIPQDADMVFCVEDDTELRPDYLEKLLAVYKTMSLKDNVGVVSGVQPGRWGFKMIGAWKADDIDEPTILQTVPYQKDGLVDYIDAAGLYCFVTSRENFCNTEFYYNSFGPDVNFGLELRRKGLKNFIDWTVNAGHVTPSRTLYVDQECVVVKYVKIDGQWQLVNPKV